MAAPRLPFLWPILFRPTKPCRPRARVPSRRPKPLLRSFATTPRCPQTSSAQRYGTAQEPAPHLRDQQAQKQSEKKASPEKSSPEPVEEEEENEPSPIKTGPAALPKTPNISESEPEHSSRTPEPPKLPESKPLDTVLHMPSPQEEEQRKAPHLKTPPYVHHFDTYSLVKDLTNSGFTQDQSVNIMKAVRDILTSNMELAREGLVSKSNVENETYLFRAACSELRTEIGNTRKGETERMRTERNQLQHEVDILGQKMSQETGHLKDELKGLFDDRKMAVRQEQRTMETKIQELNYKITVALNSDARSEVEGLRWILTRRAAITIGVSAFMLFISLRYSSYVNHAQSEERKKAEKKKPPPEDEQSPSSVDGNANALGKEVIGGELLATEGGVSLG